MKNFIRACLAALMIITAVPYVNAEDDNTLKPICELDAIRHEVAEDGSGLVWVDEDCDGKCDFAIVHDPWGQPVFPVTCEEADEGWKRYEADQKLKRGY